VLLKLLAVVLPLGLDTFAVAAALGLAGLSPGEQRRVTLLFTVFEMGMPLAGLLAGGLAGVVLGTIADYVAIAVLIGLGIYLVWPRNEQHENQRAGVLARTRGFAAIGLGISISLDELAIGFTLGLLHIAVPLVIGAIGVQTLVATQLGIRLGARVGETVRENAERLAGFALTALGVFLLVEKLYSTR
jgi:putative Mn2+ efflux pump MntP